MVFVDGLGLGLPVLTNPYHCARTPFLDAMLGGHIMYAGQEPIKGPGAWFIPTDACLQVAGIPQSATGQASIWTGINAAMRLGRHLPAYPNAALREMLSEHSIFKRIARAGRRATFANAYRPEYFDLIAKKKARWSTSSWALISGGQTFRLLDDLKIGLAVYHDYTNRLLAEQGYDVNILNPPSAGENLGNLAVNHDFTLYEYFISDQVGHKQDMPRAIQLLEALDEFLSGAAGRLRAEEDLLLLISDHGNLEDLSTKGHTKNMVPTLLIGNKLPPVVSIRDLTDVVPFIYDYLGMKEEAKYDSKRHLPPSSGPGQKVRYTWQRSGNCNERQTNRLRQAVRRGKILF